MTDRKDEKTLKHLQHAVNVPSSKSDKPAKMSNFFIRRKNWSKQLKEIFHDAIVSAIVIEDTVEITCKNAITRNKVMAQFSEVLEEDELMAITTGKETLNNGNKFYIQLNMFLTAMDRLKQNATTDEKRNRLPAFTPPPPPTRATTPTPMDTND